MTNARKFNYAKNGLCCQDMFTVVWEPVVLIGSTVFPVILCSLVTKENIMCIMLRQISPIQI